MSDEDRAAVPSIAESICQHVETQAHQAYFGRRQFDAALQLWLTRARLGPPNIETQLATAHCEIELAPAAALADIVISSPAQASNGKRDLYLWMIRSFAFSHWSSGDTARAAQLTRLIAAAAPPMRAFYDQAILPPGDAGAAALPLPADPAGRLPFQQADDLDDAAVLAAIERHRHRRVLLLLRGFGGPLTDVPRGLTLSLTALGIDWMALNSHPADEAARTSFVDRLRTALSDFRPDLVLYDDVFVSGPGPAWWTPAIELLEAARRAHGTKVMFTYPDAWYDGMADLYDTTFHLADLCHVPHPGLRKLVSPAAAERLFFYPYPVVEPTGFHAGSGPRRQRAFFAGTTTWATPSRLAWWTEIANAGLPIDLFGNIAHGRSVDDYVQLYCDYAIAVNFTRRSNGTGILTARSAETLYYGALLLEEACEDTLYFLRPYDHFVPFSTLAELKTRLGQLLDAPERLERIRQSGEAWGRRYFNGRQFWARVFHRLYEVAVSPALPVSTGRPIHVDVPGPPAIVVQHTQPQGPTG